MNCSKNIEPNWQVRIDDINQSPYAFIVPISGVKEQQQKIKSEINNDIKKGPFSREEDDLIRKFINENGASNWPMITCLLPTRTPKQCRERWIHNLNPDIFHDAWTGDVDNLIYKNVLKYGKKWSLIAQYIPGRTSNSIKNRYYSSICKRIVEGSNVLLPDETKRKPRRSKLLIEASQTRESKIKHNVMPKFKNEINEEKPKKIEESNEYGLKYFYNEWEVDFNNGNDVSEEESWFDNFVSYEDVTQ